MANRLNDVNSPCTTRSWLLIYLASSEKQDTRQIWMHLPLCRLSLPTHQCHSTSPLNDQGTFFQRFCCKREEKEVLDEQLEIWSFLLFLRMRIVGLTGGIASGKSTISNLFKANSIPVVDADVVARDVLRKGTGGWKRVVAAFGEDVLQDNGEVDRARLGQIVFSDAAKRRLLNGLLAPFISSGISWEVARLWIKGSKVIVLDIPLLFEAKMDRFTKPIIVVWVDSETQLQRLMARDGISEEQALNRINAQTALDWKKTKADIVIDNSGSLEETKEQFQRVLVQITRPLNWRESVLSRSGAFWVLVSVILGVLVYRYIL